MTMRVLASEAESTRGEQAPLGELHAPEEEARPAKAINRPDMPTQAEIDRHRIKRLVGSAPTDEQTRSTAAYPCSHATICTYVATASLQETSCQSRSETELSASLWVSVARPNASSPTLSRRRG